MKSERRRLYMDIQDGGPGPKRGDFVVSMGKKGIGTMYKVLRSRKVQRRDAAALPRFTLFVKIWPKEKWPPPSGQVFEFRWYPRKKKTFEQWMKRRV